jgi:hypothetical protein
MEVEIPLSRFDFLSSEFDLDIERGEGAQERHENGRI